MTTYKDPRDILDTPFDDESPIVYAQLSQRDVRSLIFHLLYAAESFDYEASFSSIIDNFNRGFKIDIPLNSQAATVTEAVILHRNKLDQDMTPYLSNWRLERIGVCTKLILRLAVWELQQQQTPATIVINEAIELAKAFAEKDAYRFVNGVLDEYAKAHGFELKQEEPAAE